MNPPVQQTEKQREIWTKRRDAVAGLVKQYFDGLGENGYAALNVLTDFASRPKGLISPETQINSYQVKAGDWISDFITAIQKQDFTYELYLEDFWRLVA